MNELDQARRWVDAAWGDRAGYFAFAFGIGGHFTDQGKYTFKHWHDRHGRWPDDRDRFLAEALERAERDDVYVAPYLRSKPSRKKGTALASDLVYADVDERLGELRGFERLLIGPGGFLVSSGEGLHAYLRIPELLEPVELEHWNRRLAARLHADAGWAENKVLRLPGTSNHKGRASGESSRSVVFVESVGRVADWTLEELAELLPALPASSTNGGEPIAATPRAEPLPPKVAERLREQPGTDRSKQVYSFVGLCLHEGLSDGETLAVGLEYAPALAKYGGRAGVEIERAIAKLRDPEFLSRDLRDKEKQKESSFPFTLPFARLSEALENVEEQPEWLWRGYAAKGVTSLLAGRPKIGKSTLVHGLLAALEQGTAFLGPDTTQTSVLLLTEEPLSAIRQKVSRFGLVSSNSRKSLREQKQNQVHLLRRAQALKTSWPAVVEQAVAYCLEHALELLVVDTFDKWTGLRGDDENKTGAILHALEPLAQATAANLAPFLITHHRKSGGQFGEAVRGGNALVGWADIVIEIDRLPASLDSGRRQRLLSCIGRFEEVPDLVVELEENSYVSVGDVEEVRADHERAELLAATRALGQSATSAEIAQELGVTESTARSRLHAAMRRGDLRRTGAGRKGDPFRWADAEQSEA